MGFPQGTVKFADREFQIQHLRLAHGEIELSLDVLAFELADDFPAQVKLIGDYTVFGPDGQKIYTGFDNGQTLILDNPKDQVSLYFNVRTHPYTDNWLVAHKVDREKVRANLLGIQHELSLAE